MPSHKSSKLFALKTINERTNDSSNEDDVKKDLAYLAKNFHKFLKMKNNGKSFGKRKFSSFKNDKKEFKKDAKESSLPQGIVCCECNGHGHLKKECPNYLRGKGKVLTTIIDALQLLDHPLQRCSRASSLSGWEEYGGLSYLGCVIGI